MNFPPSPSVGATVTGVYGEVYTWDGSAWTLTEEQTGSGVAVRPATAQRFTSGSGTYTPPAGISWIKVRMVGGGGGGGGTIGGGGAVPEPGTFALLGTGLAGLATQLRRRFAS